MSILSDKELTSVYGGTYIYRPFELIYEIYRTIKIRLLMKKVFID